MLGEAQALEQPRVPGAVVGHHRHRGAVLEALHEDAASGGAAQEHRPAQQGEPLAPRPVEETPHQRLDGLGVVFGIEKVEVGAGAAVLRDVARVLDDAGAGESPAVLAREKELAGGMAEERVPAPQQRSHVEVEPGHPLAAAAVQALGEVDELALVGAGAGDLDDLEISGHDARPTP